MASSSARVRVAIIGVGPRGLGAAEALIKAAGGAAIALDCFDPHPWPGAGPNFSPEQSPHCLLNLPLRRIDIPPPPAASDAAPEMSQWLDGALADPERYPPRAELGAYLAHRFSALVERAGPALDVRIRAERVRAIEADADGWRVIGDDGPLGAYDEALLTLGQPETAQDDQQERWTRHAQTIGAAFLPAYPDGALLRAAEGWSGRRVGVRGLGLTTFDVVRLLTRGLGGRFEGSRYLPSGREPARILPFSLDGRAPAPKPADARIDAHFDPSAEETRAFERALERGLPEPSEQLFDRIDHALASSVRRIAAALDAPVSDTDILDWLAQERSDPAAHADTPPVTLLKQEIAMADGAAAPSIGYAVGQVWRKWQNPLRREFNGAVVDLEIAQALVGFDESLKRFSYGPPAGSARELLALIDAGLVDLRVADDPDIALIESGWRLEEGDAESEVAAMVDGVLPSPSLDSLRSPLIDQLTNAGRITPFGEGFGARTGPDGQLIGPDGGVQRGLCLLGRLALGTVISVDSVHDCFGAAATRWARGVVDRSLAGSGARQEPI